MKVVYVDIVSYSRRKAHAQADVIHAFMKSIGEALSQTAQQYFEYFDENDLKIKRDVVVLPSGDGAALGFPFAGIHDMHLAFSRHLLKLVDQNNRSLSCGSFVERGWCDCHGAFLLRSGISEGKLILYKDLNDNYNIAGDPINMAARVMALANSSQVFSTEHAYSELTEFVPGLDKQFRQYKSVLIKHDLRINVYQYIDSNQPGLDVSHRNDLGSQAELNEGQNENSTGTSSVKKRTNTLHSRDINRRKGSTYSKHVDPRSSLAEEVRLRMKEIPSGEFLMGTVQTGQVVTTISTRFLMDKFPITQTVYEHIMNRNPSRFAGPDKPVDSVSWHDAVSFCNELSRLSELEPVYRVNGQEVAIDLRKNGYRLPTEAEWEYACLGGSTEGRYGAIGGIAWYNGNSDGETQPVGNKLANAFGLYDMLGNVWEWCNDWFQKKHPTNPSTDYMGPPSGYERVIRGGSWADLPNNITAQSRSRKAPTSRESTLGFRVVMRSHS